MKYNPESFIDVSSNGKKWITIVPQTDQSGRTLQITTSNTLTYVAVKTSNIDELMLNINVDREEFVDSILILFPELRRA